jgi:L-ribulokinase
MNPYVIGIDFGTNSVRALLIDASTGSESCGSIYNYRHGTAGVISDKSNHLIARQHPSDYTAGLLAVVDSLLAQAGKLHDFSRNLIQAIGVDTTASTPLPLDEQARPLAFNHELENDINAYAWLWKDHSSHAEAEEIIDYVRKSGFDWFKAYSGWYSPEWFWAKILRCARIAPAAAAAAVTWAEQSDFIPAFLTGVSNFRQIRRNACAAGYKDMFNRGYPRPDDLNGLSSELSRLAECLPDETVPAGRSIGHLCRNLAKRWGLSETVIIASGLIDAHAGAIGAGITPGSLVKNIGTSSCDMALLPEDAGIGSIPGISGVVSDGIIPGYTGIEAGQAAVGDILNWYVSKALYHGRDNADGRIHSELTALAGNLRAGQSGLLALDWMNGNRNILMDQRLTGLILGQTLATTPAETYRSLIEATGFGARVIIEKLRANKVPVERIICCGGIAEKNPLFMQIYSDIFNMPVYVSSSANAPALGAAISASVAAGIHPDFETAQERMAAKPSRSYEPDAGEAEVYERLYRLYLMLHDAFGKAASQDGLSSVMKELLELKGKNK